MLHKATQIQKMNIATKRLRVTSFALMSTVFLFAGCRQDMHNQPKFVPQRGTEFYADGRSVRPQVVNTVGRNQLHQDTYFFTGMVDGAEGNSFPMPVTTEVLARGQERYNVFCTPCHSRVGNGVGMIVQRGYRPAGNFHTERLRNMPLGHFFSVVTNGYGAMPEYAAQLTPEDRWAVVAYIRALQLSQNATQADVSGQQTEALGEIAQKEGLPPGFAHDWALPATAKVIGTPSGQDEGIPGQDKVMAPSGRSSARVMNQTAAHPASSKSKLSTASATPTATSPAQNHRP